MKKMASAVPLTLIVGVVTFLFIFMCMPEKPSDSDAVLTISLHFLRTRFLFVAVLGGILMTTFYHLTLFVFRQQEKAYLLFSLLCLSCIVYFLFVQGGLNDYYAWIPAGVFLEKLRDVTFFLQHYTILTFALFVFSKRFLQTYKMMMIAYLFFGIAYFVFTPIDMAFRESIAAVFILAVCIVFLVHIFKSPVLRENQWTMLYFIAILVYICISIANQIIIPGLLFMPGLLSNLFMILSQSVLLSKNYTDAFTFVEETNVNLEQIVGERTKDLQNANTAMKELVSNISHDLKTPLAVMSVNLETLSGLAETQNDADFRRHVRTAYQKNLDLQRLIQNLFEVSRIETGRSLYEPKWESLMHLLVQAREKYDDFLEGNGIQLDIDVEGDIQISADPQKIWSVFDNIIYNAARHTESGGSIKIAVHSGETSATVTITDTGCGIATEHLPQIFERFYKASKARGEKEGDSGLGLYIVKSVMEGCGGSVKAESELGKGTSIILTFPARATG